MKQLFLVLMMLINVKLSAQNTLTISGKITDEKQKPIAGATIFIANTSLAAPSDANGQFEIVAPGPGSYHVAVQMLGYAPIGEDVMLTDKSQNLNFTLTLKPIALKQVTIGTDADREYNLSTFEKEFLGRTKNARSCTILNPQVINLSTSNGTLYADADDFIIIENKKLGYRIKYLLRSFEYSTSDNAALSAVFAVQNSTSNRTAYDGDAYFEELPATDKQKAKWAQNRLETYNGSMMQYMRAVYAQNTLQQGFVTHELLNSSLYNPRLANLNLLATPMDKSFVLFRFGGLVITYDPAKARKLLTPGKAITINPLADPPRVENNSSSSLIEHIREGVVIDNRGAIFTGYVVSFLIRGPWTYKRVGDQLPFEYQP